MGWVQRRGQRWIVRWRADGETLSVGGFPTKSSARAYLAQVTVDRTHGRYVDPRGGDVTVGEWAAEWIASRPGLKASTAATDRGRLATHILPSLGSVPLGRLTPLAVRRWTAGLLDAGLAPKTVRNCHGLLHTLLRDAVAEGLIAGNPAVRTGLPEVPPSERRVLTGVEADRLVAALPEHWRTLVVLLAGTGLRWGEAAGLKVGRVDLLARQVHVVEALHEVDGRMSFGTPKSRSSRRTVSLPANVVDALVPLVAGRASAEAVFVTPGGRLVRRNWFRKTVWLPACAQAGLDGLHVHDLRHTHATWLIMAGIPLTVVQRRLGHASIKVTSDVYGHVTPAAEEAVLRVLDEGSRSVTPEAAAH